MALDSPLWRTESSRGFADREPFEVNEDECFPLPASEFGESFGDPTLKRGVSDAGGGNGFFFVPNGTPPFPNSSPAPMSVCLVHENPVEPGLETGILPETAQCPIGFDEGILSNVLGSVLIATNEAPGQAPSLVAMGRDEGAKARL